METTNFMEVFTKATTELSTGIDYKDLLSVNSAIASLSALSDRSNWQVAKIIKLADAYKSYELGYKKDGVRVCYKSLDKWGATELGYSKSSIYNLKKCVEYVFKVTVDDNGNDVFEPYDEMVCDLSTGKIQILFPLFEKYTTNDCDWTYANSMIRQLFDDKKLTFMTTSKDLKALVKQELSDSEAIDGEAREVESDDTNSDVETQESIPTDNDTNSEIDSVPTLKDIHDNVMEYLTSLKGKKITDDVLKTVSDKLTL